MVDNKGNQSNISTNVQLGVLHTTKLIGDNQVKYLSSMNYNNQNNLFHFVANNSKNEIGFTGYKNGETFLTNSFKANEVNSVVLDYMSKGGVVFADHSHPKETIIMISDGDVSSVKEIEKVQGFASLSNIYSAVNGKSYPFDKHTKKNSAILPAVTLGK